MSKMSELDMVLKELKSCGEALAGIADELREIFSDAGTRADRMQEAEPDEDIKEQAGVGESEAKRSMDEQEKEPADEAAKVYTFTEIRTILADKSKAGHTAEIRKILAKHGAEKLSEIKPEEYAAVIAEAEVLE